MVKMIGVVSSGILLFLMGGYFAYLYITGREDGSSPVLLIPSASLVVVGVYCFFKAIRILTAPKPATGVDALVLQGTPSSRSGTNILKKNNEMVKDYNKTMQTQDQLKVLQAAGAAEEGS